MKYSIAFIFLLSLLIYSCTNEGDLVEIFKSNDKTKILDRSTKENNISRQLVLGNWIQPPCDVIGDLQIFIAPECIGTEWENGILEGINAYNILPTGIYFSQTTIETEADIVFECADFANNSIIGLGEWPDEDEEVGGRIYLNTDYINCNDCFLQGVVMHEIGHNLGLGHNEELEGSNWQVGEWVLNDDGTFTHLGGSMSGTWIPGTAVVGTFDPGSIFNRTASCSGNSNCTFNANDILAIQALYPEILDPCDCPATTSPCKCPDVFPSCACEESLDIAIPTIWEEEGCVEANVNITLCAYGWAGEPMPNNTTFQWSLNGSLTSYDPLNQRCIHINVGEDGGFASVFVITDCGPISINREINICEEETTTGGGTTIPDKKGKHIE